MDEVIQRFIAEEGEGEPLSIRRWQDVTRHLSMPEVAELLRQVPQPFLSHALGPVHPNDPLLHDPR